MDRGKLKVEPHHKVYVEEVVCMLFNTLYQLLMLCRVKCDVTIMIGLRSERSEIGAKSQGILLRSLK
jgi:hypothetical protein